MRPLARYLALATLQERSLTRELIIADTAESRFVRLRVPFEVEVDLPGWLDLEGIAPLPDIDPARPEQVSAASMHRIRQPVKRRALARVLEGLCQTEELPPLFLPGPSVAYSRFDATFPSVVGLRLREPALVPSREGSPVLEFTWGGKRQSLPLTKELATGLELPQRIAGRQWRLVRPRTPEVAIVAYDAPFEGYCKKWVVRLY
jgi:hypothetical protein